MYYYFSLHFFSVATIFILRLLLTVLFLKSHNELFKTFRFSYSEF